MTSRSTQSQSHPSLNLSGSEFSLKQGLRTSEVCDLLRMLAGIDLSSKEIRQALKKRGVLELQAGQSILVVKLAHQVKQRGRYRCDVFARPISFVA